MAKWPDIYYGQLQGLARQQAFSIAGITSLDTLQAVKESLDKVIAEGGTFGAWKKHMLESGTLNLPKHRLDNIYRTNLQGSYMAARWDRILLTQATRPYIMYDALNDSRVRPAHLALDGIIRRVDDPFWTTHSPPNGYRCRCSIRSLSEHQARARSGPGKGLNNPALLEDGTPALPDKGWDYNPSDRLAGIRQAITDRASQCTGLFIALSGTGKKRHNSPIWCNGTGADVLSMVSAGLNGSNEMPPPKNLNLQVFDKGKDDKFYLTQFMQQFGGAYDDQVIIEAKTGLHKLLVSDELFTNHKKGDYKIAKQGREQYVLYIADTILNPDEIRLEEGDFGDQHLYFLSRYLIKKEIMNVLAVFRKTKKVWTGWTGYQNFRSDYFETKRTGQLIYKK
jgi:SPP1 gp7 family putative phage head morphogenesis protein